MDNSPLIDQYNRRLNGSFYSPRMDYIMLKKFELQESEWFLYKLIKDVVTDWDHKHPLYGHFFYNEQQLHFYTNWHMSKIKRIFKKILSKRFVEQIEPKQKLYHVVGFGLQNQILKKENKNEQEH